MIVGGSCDSIQLSWYLLFLDGNEHLGRSITITCSFQPTSHLPYKISTYSTCFLSRIDDAGLMMQRQATTGTQLLLVTIADLTVRFNSTSSVRM